MGNPVPWIQDDYHETVHGPCCGVTWPVPSLATEHYYVFEECSQPEHASAILRFRCKLKKAPGGQNESELLHCGVPYITCGGFGMYNAMMTMSSHRICVNQMLSRSNRVTCASQVLSRSNRATSALLTLLVVQLQSKLCIYFQLKYRKKKKKCSLLRGIQKEVLH